MNGRVRSTSWPYVLKHLLNLVIYIINCLLRTVGAKEFEVRSRVYSPLILSTSALMVGILTAFAQEGAPERLTLQEFVQRVLNYNETLQIQVLQTELGRKQLAAERGIFEPEFTVNGEYLDSDRPNTTQQQRELQGVSEFDQENVTLSTGVESLLPTGARFRLGYSMSELSNNLQRQGSVFSPAVRGDEYVAFTGLTAVQPLLRNGWRVGTMSKIRMAAKDSEMAFHQYRRELIKLISTAEVLYWDLYYSQERAEVLLESVKIAEKLYKDTQTKKEIGRASDLEVLEVESVMAQRKTQYDDALQTVQDNVNRLASLYSRSLAYEQKKGIVALDEPKLVDIRDFNFYELNRSAYEANPDFLIQKLELSKRNIQLAYAKNQKLPQLDLRASYGLNGLGDSYKNAFEDADNADFVAWSVGFDFRVPIGGNRKATQEYEAAKIQVKQVLLALKSTENQIANSIETGIHNIKRMYDSVLNHQKVVGFYENLFQTQLERFEVGVINNQRLLDTEAELLQIRIDALQRMVGFQRSLVDIYSISGSLLKQRNIELDQDILAARTSEIISELGLSGDDYEEFMRRTSQHFRYGPAVE